MYLILSSLLYSLSSNLDNIVIGIAYGIKKIRIKISSNLLIAFITSLGTLISMSVGQFIYDVMPVYITNTLGAGIIIILGIYFIFNSVYKLKTNNKSEELALKNLPEAIEYAEMSDMDNSGSLSIKETFFVALGLTLNNLGTGLAASITGVNTQLTVLFTFILSIIFFALGRALGNNVLGSIFGKYAPLISGILLIILGIIEFLN